MYVAVSLASQPLSYNEVGDQDNLGGCTASEQHSPAIDESSDMEVTSNVALSRDPCANPMSDITEQLVDPNDPSPAGPKLVSLSSGSKSEDQFREACEEPSIASETLSDQSEKIHVEEAKESTEHGSSEELVSVELHDGDGGGESRTSEDGGSSCKQQRSGSSIDREFVMITYPAALSSSDCPDPKHPQVSLSSSQCDSSPSVRCVDAKPIATEGTPMVQPSCEENQSSLSTTKLETMIAVTQLESSELEQKSVNENQEVTAGESGLLEREGEGAVKSEGEALLESADGDKEKEQVGVPAFESLGLLYARSPDFKHDRYMCLKYNTHIHTHTVSTE